MSSGRNESSTQTEVKSGETQLAKFDSPIAVCLLGRLIKWPTTSLSVNFILFVSSLSRNKSLLCGTPVKVK